MIIGGWVGVEGCGWVFDGAMHICLIVLGPFFRDNNLQGWCAGFSPRNFESF